MLVVEAMKRAQSLFPWLVLGADFDNDSAFMNDVVVPWCRRQKIEVTRSRAYKKNDQAFVEQRTAQSSEGLSATVDSTASRPLRRWPAFTRQRGCT